MPGDLQFLTVEQRRQICADLSIKCPVRRWQMRKDGSVAVYTRAGMQIWKPPRAPRKRTKRAGRSESATADGAANTGGR